MNYSEITCPHTNKTFKPDKMYKVRGDKDTFETIVSTCYCCPYSDSKNAKCKNCYGTITQKTVKTLSKKTQGAILMNYEHYINTFIRQNGDIIQNMKSDEIMDAIEIIANLNSANWNHGKRIEDHLRAYDRPKTWKTDCAECKRRCELNGSLPACVKAQQYLEDNNMNLNIMNEKQISEINLPCDCICQEQTQQMYFV